MNTNDFESISVPVEQETLEEFSDYLKEKNRSNATIRKYVADLRSFYNFLPENKLLVKNSLPQWRDLLIQKGHAPRTINTRIAACNSFLGFLGHKEWQVSPIALQDLESTEAITREDYCLLLQTAHHCNKQWLYFVIKAFCCLGLSVSELPFLTVDALVAGYVPVKTKSREKNIFIPLILQEEMLHFAIRERINSGALFKSQDSEPLSRTYLTNELKTLCEEANIPEGKVTLKNLRELYFTTYSQIRSTSSELFNKEYSKILEEEEHRVGWDALSE